MQFQADILAFAERPAVFDAAQEQLWSWFGFCGTTQR